MKPQLCSPLGRIFVLIFGLLAVLASPFHAAAALPACTASNLPTGPAAFIATAPNLVTVLDASTNTVACIVTVGSGPVNLAVSPDGSQLFVENDTDATITVVNLADGSIAATLALAGVTAPMTANLAISPDNTKVYVVSLPATLIPTTQASLNVITLPSLAVSAAAPIVAPLPATPTPVTAPGLGVAFTPDATKAYIATEGLTYIVTTATNSVSATILTNGGTAAVQQTGTFAYVVDVAANPSTVSQIAVSN